MAVFSNNQLSPSDLADLSPRKRAVLKLRTGFSALSSDELSAVLPEKQSDAQTIKKRSLRQVAALLGISKERVRQLEDRALVLLRRAGPAKQQAEFLEAWHGHLTCGPLHPD